MTPTPKFSLARSSSFCLLVVLTIIGTTYQSFELFLYPILIFFSVVIGAMLLTKLSSKLTTSLYYPILSLMIFMFTMIPVLMESLWGIEVGFRQKFVSSLCLGFSWIVAESERKNACPLSSSALRFMGAFLAFAIIIFINSFIRIFLAQPPGDHVAYDAISSVYWQTLSGSFVVSGILLLLLELFENAVLNKQE